MVSEGNSSLTRMSTHMPSDDNNHGDSDEGNHYTIFLALSIIVVLLGLVGNSLNFVLFNSVTYNRLSFAVYMRVLAVSDSFVLIVNIIEEINQNNLNGILFSTRALCNVNLFITFLGKLASSLVVIAISVDRYIAVVYPLHRTALCTFRRAIVLSTCLVFLSAGLCLTAVIWHEAGIGQSDARNNASDSEDDRCPNFESKGFDLYGTVILSLFVMVGPVCVVSLLNVRIFWTLKTHIKLREVSCTTRVAAGFPVKMTLTLVAATFSSVIFSMPLITVEFMEFGGVTDVIMDNAWRWASLVHMLNYALNFYIIVIHGREYRQTLKRVFGLRASVPRSNDNTSRTFDGTVVKSTSSASVVST